MFFFVNISCIFFCWLLDLFDIFDIDMLTNFDIAKFWHFGITFINFTFFENVFDSYFYVIFIMF